MEDPMLSPVTVEVAHAPSPWADLVAGHVAPAAVAQAHATPSRKRQGNVVVQGGNQAAPAATACAPGANAAVRFRPAAEKAGKAAGVKRRKVPASRKPPYSTSDFIPPQGGAPTMPFNDVTPLTSEVFDGMAGSGGSKNATTEFMNMLDTNAVDIDQASFETFDYNETDIGVDDHGCADELEEIEAEAFEQSQAKSGKSQRSKNYTILKDRGLDWARIGAGNTDMRLTLPRDYVVQAHKIEKEEQSDDATNHRKELPLLGVDDAGHPSPPSPAAVPCRTTSATALD
ncbi:galacturonosyltransferase 14 [Hordeum vulgare]|nr:galacturonosyltransferase 14 [Hordeum vulgare]